MQAVRDPAELCALLELPEELHQQAGEAIKSFPMRVPRSFIARMRKGDIHDPLLRQVLPLNDELKIVPGFVDDPVGEKRVSVHAGTLHKYHGRLLLTVSGACGVHCRYCFRRHFPYSQQNPSANNWQDTVKFIEKETAIDEVILSGGDPLLLETQRLRQLTDKLVHIPHLKRIRVHSRLPVVLPQRIDPELLDWLQTISLKTIMVIHANHAQELDLEVAAAMEKLRQAGVILLNQSVLLRGVNDSVASLKNLSERLFELNIQPYYLHMLDKVSGAAHFDVAEDRALALMDKLRSRLPGYLIPQLVREIEGAPSKIPVGV